MDQNRTRPRHVKLADGRIVSFDEYQRISGQSQPQSTPSVPLKPVNNYYFYPERIIPQISQKIVTKILNGSFKIASSPTNESAEQNSTPNGAASPASKRKDEEAEMTLPNPPPPEKRMRFEEQHEAFDFDPFPIPPFDNDLDSLVEVNSAMKRTHSEEQEQTSSNKRFRMDIELHADPPPMVIKQEVVPKQEVVLQPEVPAIQTIFRVDGSTQTDILPEEIKTEEMSPGSPVEDTKLNGLYEETDSISKKLAEESLNTAMIFFNAGNHRTAIIHFNQAIRLTPNDSSLYLRRSAAYEHLFNHQAAIEDARVAISLNPRSDEAFARLVRCYLCLGDLTAVEQNIKSCLQIDAGNFILLTDEIGALKQLRLAEQDLLQSYRNEELQLCVNQLDRALEIAVASVRLQLLRAECLILLGRPHDAEAIINACLATDSRNAEAVYLHGLKLFYNDQEQESVAHFGKALRFDPDHKRAKDMRFKAKLLLDLKEQGNQLVKEGHFDDAYETYTEALAIDARTRKINSILLCNRAFTCLKRGRLAEGIADCTAALEINPRYVKALLRRAQCHMDLLEFGDAIRDYESAWRLDPRQEYAALLDEARRQLDESKRPVNYYEVMEIRWDADLDEIKKAYKRLALVHHPDRHSAAPEADRKRNEMTFKRISEAYNVLIDPRTRKHYNDQLRREKLNANLYGDDY